MTGNSSSSTNLKRPNAPAKRRRNTGNSSAKKPSPAAGDKQPQEVAPLSPTSKQKSSSAPASPNKSALTVITDQPVKRPRMTSSSSSSPSYPVSNSTRASLSPRTRRSSQNNLLMAAPPSDNPPAAKGKKDEAAGQYESNQSRMLLSDSKKPKKSSKPVSMNEVIKLHQDEGVMHLLHALPATRRKPSATHVSVNNSSLRRRPSCEVERGPNKGHAQASSTSAAANPASASLNAASSCQGRPAKPLTVRAALTQRLTDPDNALVKPIDPSKIKPVSQDELMTQMTLDILKQLPKKEYARLWSSPSRYVMAKNRRRRLSSVVESDEKASSASSPNSVASSAGSSASQPVARTIPWKLNVKHFKDVLIRTYPTFAQVILSPTTTGLRHSINANVVEELTDVLRQLAADKECKAVLVTGIGSAFCQGIDLTLLASEASADKQKRAAETLANAIKKLAKFLLAYDDKVLVAAVNGLARGLGVGLLPYFDLVFASDKADFAADYVRLGQIPEMAFSSTTDKFNDMLFLGRTLTASEMQSRGLVTEVVWPDKFLEEVVPRMETIDFMTAAAGVKAVKAAVKRRMRNDVSAVIDEETRELVSRWSTTEFAKNVRQYLKTSHFMFQ